MMFKLLFAAAILALAAADITGTNPPTGTCLCINARSNVNIRDAGCGNVIGSASPGQCFTYSGLRLTCDLGASTYQFFRMNYGGGQGWAAGDFLVTADASRCSRGGGGGGDCGSVEIVSRAEWGARAPRRRATMRTPVGYMFVHHTAGAGCSSLSSCSSQMRNIQNYHMNSRGWSDIGYNWLVGGDGRVYEGRGWDAVGGHTYGYNSIGAAVCFIGTFTSSRPTQAAIDAAQDIIDCGLSQGKLTSGYEVFGHRNAGCTACPGDALYAEIQSWPRFSTRSIPRYCRKTKFEDLFV